MSFRSIVRDVRDSFGSLSRRSFEVRLPGHHRGKSHGSVHEMHEPPFVNQNSPWANLPPELLRDVIKRLEESENTWPSRRHVVACGGVCRSWRDMCKEIVRNPEFCGKLTFPVSLKQIRALFVACGGVCRSSWRRFHQSSKRLEEVPSIQQKIVQKCRDFNKPVIVASQLLESMIEYPTPTRAEVADVSEAVRQRAAMGQYPEKALSVLRSVSV